MPIFLGRRGVRYRRESPLRVTLVGIVLGKFRADFVVDDKVLVELKACERIIAAHEAQLISYLKASGYNIGLLLNFGPKPELRRIIWTTTSVCSKIADRVLRDHEPRQHGAGGSHRPHR